jgi:hypothetical protein
VFYTRRYSGEVWPFFHCQRLVFGFSIIVLCIPLFLQYSLSLYCLNFIEIFIG